MTTTPTAPAVPILDAALSTQPRPVGPPKAQRLAPVRRAWRQLTSMRTALQLLFLLALASVPGSFLPQRDLNPIKVEDYLAAHPTAGPLLDRVGAFDTFASPWFSAVYLLLFVSLVGCLVPRIRLHAKALRTPPPKVPKVLHRLPVSDTWQTGATPDEVAAAATSVLRKARWRVVRRDTEAGPELSAEKGYLRETGNLVFHVSLVALLAGIAWGAFSGFQGTVLVKEGQGFANTIASFDDYTPGRAFTAESLEKFVVDLEDFRATYRDDGNALTFNADVRWSTLDGERKAHDLRVNHPLAVGDAKVYLLGHGYSVKVEVRDPSGAVVLDQVDAVPCLPQDANFLSTCAIKVTDPTTPDQIAFQGVFTPRTVQDPVTLRIGSSFPAADAPALTVVGYRGDLGLDSGAPVSVYRIDTEDLDPVDGGRPQRLDPGQTWEMPGGGSITFVGVDEWATLQVTQDPGKRLVLGASAAMVLGLVLSLFVRRRRVWVRVLPGEQGRTVVHVGGLARTDAERFPDEFAELAGRLGRPGGGP